MKIFISKDVYKTILEHCRKEFPLEACGLIAGRKSEALKEVTKVYLVKNVEESRYRFSIDPKEQLEAIRSIRKEGLTPLGNFHSHPETPARPSDEDLKLYLDPGASYLILSLTERLGSLKSFGVRLDNGQTVAVPEELEIV
jgi:proteasome lid subunit RPN8/RPN11